MTHPANTGMAGSMIERVARAIYAADEIPDGWTWDREDDPTIIGNYMELARAALGAMREPTEAMCTAGYFDARHSIEAVDDLCEVASEDQPAEIWRTMIDAALAEGKD